jgi:hypothetical protein
MKPAGRRRGFKSWFVEPYRQVKLGLMFLVVNILFSGLILGVFGYYIWDMYVAVSSYFHLTQDQSGLALAKFSTPMIVGSGLIALFVVTTILISVKYTHEIYGPLVSIHRFLDQFLEGKRPDALHLRESDQLKDLALKLNTAAETIAGDKRQSSFVPVYRYLDDLIEGKNPEPLKLRDADQLNTLVEKLNKLAAKLKK